MGEKSKGGVAAFIAEHCVSWIIELTVLGVIAYFTIAETRKTAEQTRDMLARYDKAISTYAAQKTQAIDSTVSAAVESTKEKAQTITAEDVKKFITDLKKAEPEDQ